MVEEEPFPIIGVLVDHGSEVRTGTSIDSHTILVLPLV
jgi:hypothetical protein